ncbi:hypothetical protein J6590_074937, partial [Homalodisca vitripennis]
YFGLFWRKGKLHAEAKFIRPSTRTTVLPRANEPIFRKTVSLGRVSLCQSRVLSFVFTPSAEEERVVDIVVLRDPPGTLRDFKLTYLKQVRSVVAIAVRNWVR